MATHTFDADGDAEMKVVQPVFEFIKAPKLTSWDQASLIKWHRQRKQYELKIQERCATTGEAVDSVRVSVRSSVEPALLERLARYVFRVDSDLVDDNDLMIKITDRCNRLMNAHLPAVEDLFAKELRMNLKEKDVEARIVEYFGDFDRIVEDNGLTEQLGTGGFGTADYRHRMKLRCKLLLAGLAPETLKGEVARLVEYQHRAAKEDDVALFDLVLKRAQEQQHFHQMQLEMGGTRKEKDDARKPAKQSGVKSDKARVSATGTTSARREATPAPKARAPPRGGCLHCQQEHWLDDCPTATESDKKAAREKMKRAKESRVVSVRTLRVADREPHVNQVIVNDVFELPFCADTGAECNIIPERAAMEMADLDILPSLVELEKPVYVEVAGGQKLKCTHECEVDLSIGTAAGPVRLRRAKCLVLKGSDDTFLLGRSALSSLGIDVNRLLEQLASPMHDDGDDIPDGMEIGRDETDELEARLTQLVDEAERNGFSTSRIRELRDLVFRYRDCFRVRLGPGPPAKVEPLKVTLRPNAKPYRCAARRYAEPQSRFMKEYVAELLKFGFVRKNNHSRWASATVPVRKAGSKVDFRITNDYRPVNRLTIPIAGASPNLRVVKQRVRDAAAMGKFDLFKGFWQFPLDEDSQEIFSFMTDDGVYTPTRVPQGAMDSPVHFQSQMQGVFADMLYEAVLIWIDDIVLYAQDDAQYLTRLEEFFERLKEHNLKLSAMKSVLFSRSVTWCGRIIDGDGVQQDPAKVEALVNLPLPENAAELQYFLCAANWFRDALVNFARVFDPLQRKLDTALEGQSRKSKDAARVPIEWSDKDREDYQAAVHLLSDPAKLVYPDDDATVCVFTDACDRGWAAVVTQVREWQPTAAIGDQRHELLACQGGCFRGSQVNWSIVEKEAYPVVQVCQELEYLLLRTHGFRLFCDHANLIKIFCPDKEMKQHVRGKLQRWSMKLVGYQYSIEHIKGIENVWADLISRWLPKATAKETIGIKAVRTRSRGATSRLRPLQQGDFEWPSRDAVVEAQELHQRQLTAEHVLEDGLIYVEGKLWIPAQARELLTRIFIVAHCGSQGHRGEQPMVEQLQQHYAISDLARHAKQFVQQCLLCKHVKGGRLVQRPWSEHPTATQRNEVIHMDYLFMGDSWGDVKYVLAIKDELTHFCQLIACTSPTSLTAVTSILEWAARFGVPDKWVSDQGSHFKSELMADLATRLRGTQAFVPVYAPWLNGTVERLNRDILQVVRIMLHEGNYDTKDWPHLLPVLQANLNQTPVESLAGKSPMELFTALPPATPLDTMLKPKRREGQFELITIDNATVEAELAKLRSSIQQWHQDVVDKKEQRRLRQMVLKKGTDCNFHVGDFVLWSRVDARLAGNKLMVRWVGPFRVVEALEYSFLIEHLLTKDRYEVHASRLKFFAEASFNVTEEVEEHVGRQGLVLAVREIQQHQYNTRTKQWELFVAWRGLQDAQSSWEPLADMYKDVPIMVGDYIDAVDDERLRQAVEQL